jgi:hypothetical protein
LPAADWRRRLSDRRIEVKVNNSKVTASGIGVPGRLNRVRLGCVRGRTIVVLKVPML